MSGCLRLGRGVAVRLALLVFGLFALVAGLPQAHAETLQGRGFKMAGDATRMRVVLQFDREPEPRWLLLRGPHRLAIDLPPTRFAFQTKDMKARGLIREVRYGALGDKGSRIVIATKGPFVVENVAISANEDGDGHRMSFEVVAAPEKAFEAALAEQAQTTASTVTVPKGDRLGQKGGADKPFTVVIDPGHGGIDGGAEGTSGAVEKDVTLAFATDLRAKLQKETGYRVFLTRDADVFLRLDDRVRIARQYDADLFISIHADTIRLKGIRGATVYTVSDKASDADSQALADRENLSDQLAGIEIEDENHQVADILVDLIRRETHSFSMSFARTLVGELSSTVGLINNPHRYAGFKVLKAPDVPSVLVELGYLSNPKDEAQLTNPEWRAKAADAIARAVGLFALAKTGG